MNRDQAIQLPPVPELEYLYPPRPWHPKLTGYRVAVLALTTGFGLSKAVLAYRGESFAAITLEWVFSVVVFLALFWLGLLEKNDPEVMPWLFQKDYAPGIWGLLAFRYLPVPHYNSDEQPLTVLPQTRHPPLTGYRMLVSALVASAGLTKATLAYRGIPVAPTTLDWAYGVVITTGLYWLGLYEKSSANVWPAFFHVDYTLAVQDTFLLAFKGTIDTSYLFLRMLVVYLATRWSNVGFLCLVGIWKWKFSVGLDAYYSLLKVLEWCVKIHLSIWLCFFIGLGSIIGVAAFVSFVKAIVRGTKSVWTSWTGTGYPYGTNGYSLFASVNFALPSCLINLVIRGLKAYISFLLLLGYANAHALLALLCMFCTSVFLGISLLFLRTFSDIPGPPVILWPFILFGFFWFMAMAALLVVGYFKLIESGPSLGDSLKGLRYTQEFILGQIL